MESTEDSSPVGGENELNLDSLPLERLSEMYLEISSRCTLSAVTQAQLVDQGKYQEADHALQKFDDHMNESARIREAMERKGATFSGNIDAISIATNAIVGLSTAGITAGAKAMFKNIRLKRQNRTAMSHSEMEYVDRSRSALAARIGVPVEELKTTGTDLNGADYSIDFKTPAGDEYSVSVKLVHDVTFITRLQHRLPQT